MHRLPPSYCTANTRGDARCHATCPSYASAVKRCPARLQVRGMRLFTRKQHVNTLAPLDDKSLWVVLHNLGKVG